MREVDFRDLLPRVGDRVMMRNLQYHVIFSYLMVYIAIKMLFCRFIHVILKSQATVYLRISYEELLSS